MPPRKQARDPRTHLGAFLGEQLREIRAEAGYPSQDDFSTAIRKDRSVIGKAETGESPPTERVLADWLDSCGVSGRLRAMFEGMTRIARMRENPGQAQAEPFYGAEARAHTVRYWAPIILPGIVQTPAYATELFKAMRFDAAKVAERLEVRMSRQAILERPDPPDITIVLWEPVLDHQIGTGETMAGQMARLVELSDMPTVTIHVLPSSHGANPGLGGAIQLAAAADAPELLLSDGLVEDQLTNDPVQVRRASSTFNSVRADALNRAGSRDVLMEAMERWSR
jgi:transcriptional regulator with XRE-family HTH domain